MSTADSSNLICVSKLRKLAIAESTIRIAGIALIAANEAKAKQSSPTFIRQVLAQAVHN
ncbi:MAG: hypothetical protein WBB01_17420 [Phormidesmis sp.]